MTAWIELENVCKKFGSVTAVDRLDLAIPEKSFLTLLGPSGCGKTTVLRMIAGLEIPDEGVIRIHGETVFSAREGVFIPPGKRRIGLVFQSYALWPHMTVFENVAFGLRTQGVTGKSLADRVEEALVYMRLRGLEGRYPQQLSGGQQQRVALARMLVTRPSIFLMDEPLSNLDSKLRMEMRTEIKRIHRETQATTVYVTHDQNEALTMSTEIAVMNAGTLQQINTPRNIYSRPANLFVADFIGSPTINLIRGEIQEEAGKVFFRNDVLRLEAVLPSTMRGRSVVAAIRPEDIRILWQRTDDTVEAEVYSILPAGAEVIIQAKMDGLIFNIRKMGEASLELGDRIHLQLPSDSLTFFDGESGVRIVPPLER